jgi:hypothetical protein
MITKMQFPLFKPESEWVPPDSLPDITDASEIAIDVETRDPKIKENGPGWPTKNGEVVGLRRSRRRMVGLFCRSDIWVGAIWTRR